MACPSPIALGFARPGNTRLRASKNVFGARLGASPPQRARPSAPSAVLVCPTRPRSARDRRRAYALPVTTTSKGRLISRAHFASQGWSAAARAVQRRARQPLTCNLSLDFGAATTQQTPFKSAPAESAEKHQLSARAKVRQLSRWQGVCCSYRRRH